MSRQVPEIMGMNAAADYLGVSRSHLSHILAGKIASVPAIPDVRAGRRARSGASTAAPTTPSTPPGTQPGSPAIGPASPEALEPFGKLSIVWHGQAAPPGRGICNLRFELRENEPGRFNVAPLMSKQANASPASSLLNRITASRRYSPAWSRAVPSISIWIRPSARTSMAASRHPLRLRPSVGIPSPRNGRRTHSTPAI